VVVLIVRKGPEKRTQSRFSIVGGGFIIVVVVVVAIDFFGA
jgi:hypothetical protein